MSPEESQPVINEELVHSLVEASQRSNQLSQTAGIIVNGRPCRC